MIEFFKSVPFLFLRYFFIQHDFIPIPEFPENCFRGNRSVDITKQSAVIAMNEKTFKFLRQMLGQFQSS